MNHREVEIYAPKDLGAAGTEVIDIKVKDPLSVIEVIFQTTVNTAAAMTAPHVDCLTKIELVDGSDVLFSLSGQEAQALAFYSSGRMPLNDISVKASEYMRSVIPIYFGRKLFDRELALDPSKFSNLQLKITWDEDAANSGVTANQLTVRGWAFDRVPVKPLGFLMAKELKSFTPAANTYEYTDLPTDYPYRLLMLRCASTTIEPNAQMNQIKISEDNDKRIPIDMTGEEVLQKLCVPFGEIEENYNGADAVTASDIYGAPTSKVVVTKDMDVGAIAAGDTYSVVTVSANKYSVTAATDFSYHAFRARGYAPHFCLPIPAGDLNDINDWYDVKGIGSLQLITQGAAAVGTSPSAQVCTQQLRKY
jgi:hypothetical protein